MHVFLLQLFLLWLGLFASLRTCFLLMNWKLVAAGTPLGSTWLASLYHGLSLDAALAAELLFAVWTLLLIYAKLKIKLIPLLMDVYMFIAICLYILIATADIFVYPEWKTHLSYRAITSLAHPSELVRISNGEQILVSSLMVAFFVGSTFVAYLFLRRRMLREPESLTKMTALLLWPFLFGFAARGGLKPIALDVSRAYFSTDTTVNDAATNPGWYLGKNLFLSKDFKMGTNPFTFYPKGDAEHEVERLHVLAADTAHPTQPILTNTRPNLVFIVLESWSADLVESLGGVPGITPEFHQLEKNGLLFTNFYANGNRSQQGIASIFSGFPALPLAAVTEDPAKARKLPRFAEMLNQTGYHTSFTYGGQLEYGNIKAFLIANGVSQITEEGDLPHDLPRGSLGIHDGPMLDYLADQLRNAAQPFAASFFTLSTHAPYDVPQANDFTFEGTEASYVRSAMYADRELGRFFRKVKNEPWYANTLFVLVADHSHNSYRNWPNWRPEYRKIPMLFYGEALRPEFRGKTMDRVGSQVDILATLLHQMQLPANAFPWSKDLFQRGNQAFAYYELNDGVGWVNARGSFVYRDEAKQVFTTLPRSLQDSVQKQAKSYVQSIFEHFLEL